MGDASTPSCHLNLGLPRLLCPCGRPKKDFTGWVVRFHAYNMAILATTTKKREGEREKSLHGKHTNTKRLMSISINKCFIKRAAWEGGGGKGHCAIDRSLFEGFVWPCEHRKAARTLYLSHINYVECTECARRRKEWEKTNDPSAD